MQNLTICLLCASWQTFLLKYVRVRARGHREEEKSGKCPESQKTVSQWNAATEVAEAFWWTVAWPQLDTFVMPPILPDRGTAVRWAWNNWTLASTALGGRTGPGCAPRARSSCWSGSKSATLCVDLGVFCCIKLIKKINFQYKSYLSQLFPLLQLEVQNKHHGTFLISYNCKLIPFIYSRFM